MKSLNPFRKRPFCNDCHFMTLGVILFLYSLKHPYLFIALGAYLIYLFIRHEMIIPVLACILVTSGIYSIYVILHATPISESEVAYVSDVSDEDTYTLYVKGISIRVTEKGHSHEPGDILKVTLEVYDPEEKSYEADFDYEEYLYEKGITYSARCKSSEKMKSAPSLYYLRYKYQCYLKNVLSEDSYNYVSSMVFGNNTLEYSLKDSYSALGISHILAISGLHILFLFKIISFLLLKAFHYYHDGISLLLISLFVILMGAPASCVRALLFLLLSSFNKKGDIRYTRLDILSVSLLLQVFYNPYQIYSDGFILSYLVSFILIFSSDVLKTKEGLVASYKSYYLIYFSTFPITLNFTNRISLLSLVLSPLLSLFVTFILLPLSYLLAVIPVSDYLLKYVFMFLNQYLEGICSYGIYIPFPSFTFYEKVLYYVFFIFLLFTFMRKKRLIFGVMGMCTYLVILYFMPYMASSLRITFTDCGQGDSIILEAPGRRGVMMIDCYHSMDYLKSLGIREIDTILITHSDDDHTGDYEEILSYFKVNHIYYPYSDSRAEELLKSYGGIPLRSGDSFLFKEYEFEVLGPINSYSDVNSNSLVVRLKLLGASLLFTGDMTKEEEGDLVSKYGNELDSDVLKVGHHGSDTSTSDEFLSCVSPICSIISVGKNNSYGLPDQEVLDRLGKYGSIYLTRDYGNIIISYKKGGLSLSTYR